MRIVNSFDDIKMVITDLNENDIRSFLDGREFAVVKIDNDPKKKTDRRFDPAHVLGILLDAYTLQIDDEDESDGRTYLYIKCGFRCVLSRLTASLFFILRSRN
ncbi:MAG: hypothetical protein IJS94_01730 [Clostridia bacterium]|nr:hypothetical protein [Clostridia bacterium]MBQ7645965.1 hypothetical protein [Clostridia bacterium]